MLLFRSAGRLWKVLPSAPRHHHRSRRLLSFNIGHQFHSEQGNKMSNNDLVETAKRLAAYRAVDNHVSVKKI